VGLNTNSHDNDVEFTVYPNPTIDRIYVQVNTEKEQMITLEIFNQSGMLLDLIYSGHPDDPHFRIEYMADLPSGLYYLVLKTEWQNYTKKLIIKK
jgi:hypothetical protein